MEFTHFNSEGRARMVEVTDKDETKRVAIAEGFISMNQETLEKLNEGKIKKGDVLSVAQVAGIMGVKKTSDLIPMCHNIFLTGADIKFQVKENGVYIVSEVKTVGKTGVEIEALTGVSVAALTIYDMCKSVDKGMTIEYVRLLKKTGGKSGDFTRE
ncbi:cyclic pyranopterin monophosphate synthase accessory protein [Andreesenia angusta]|uniref:Cyclic pyranopterin monophosphate synthase n=1 Tax=Andreesenia angusta TaxID=39480 RepID=A0A1S1V4N6_9FIRM|nr:cyclic pyranopterin monophosphate synthase MoaC [Andreesenia angusta]OHW61350.1 cyclic pyranopterin monophosphate synthase accessory protein [Andreesenia angusta]